MLDERGQGREKRACQSDHLSFLFRAVCFVKRGKSRWVVMELVADEGFVFSGDPDRGAPDHDRHGTGMGFCRPALLHLLPSLRIDNNAFIYYIMPNIKLKL
jgi:hypothetical protein